MDRNWSIVAGSIPGGALLGLGIDAFLRDGIWHITRIGRAGLSYQFWSYTMILWGAYGLLLAWRYGYRGFFLVVIAGLFTVLLFVLGSVLIPIRAILTILLSVCWTLALTILVFHVWKGYDIIFILPLALFVMAMGLGMDYDIFIITRIREEVSHGKKDAEAIADATTRTGGIISACGIVMAGAFATLMLNPSPFLQEIGFALAFAILLDSMVVRIYLVPAIMVLAGKGNWWAPGPLQRVHLEEKEKKPAPSKTDDIDD